MIKLSGNSHKMDCMVCLLRPSFLFLIDFSHFDPQKFQSELIASYVSCHKEGAECVLKTGYPLSLSGVDVIYHIEIRRFFSLNKRRALKDQESKQGSF